MNPEQRPFLIIGGTTKSGTTSLYNYLKDHPEVCGSSMKETRFFLDPAYPLKSKYNYTDGLDRYMEFFSDYQNGQLCIEATPDYLYSKNSASAIHDHIPQAKLVFILREPASRLISWYNFSKQTGRLPQESTLEEYIALQQNHAGDPEQALMTLEQGRYSVYLKSFRKYFAEDRILLLYYEDLKNDVRALMKELSSFAGIDPEFYNLYNFQQFNKTVKVNHQGLHKKYMEVSYHLRKLTHNKKFIHGSLKSIKKMIHPLYMAMNSSGKKQEEDFSNAMAILGKYYHEENIRYQERYLNQVETGTGD